MGKYYGIIQHIMGGDHICDTSHPLYGSEKDCPQVLNSVTNKANLN